MFWFSNCAGSFPKPELPCWQFRCLHNLCQLLKSKKERKKKGKEKEKEKEKRKRKRWFPDSSRGRAQSFPLWCQTAGARLALALGSVCWRWELVTDCLPLIESSAESGDARPARRAWKAGRLLVPEFLCTLLPRESMAWKIREAAHVALELSPSFPVWHECWVGRELAWINDSCGGQQKSFSPSLVMCTCFPIGTVNPNFRHLSCFPHFVMPPFFSSPVMLNPGQRYQTAHLQPNCTQFTRVLAFSDKSMETSASRCSWATKSWASPVFPRRVLSQQLTPGSWILSGYWVLGLRFTLLPSSPSATLSAHATAFCLAW